MQNTRSRLESRLARLVAAAPRHIAPHLARSSRLDLVYLSESDQQRLETRLK